MWTVTELVVRVALATLVAVGGMTTEASATEMPAGRRIYSVALGAIPSTSDANAPVFVRITLYYFFGDGTVREGFWFWSRTQAIGAANTGINAHRGGRGDRRARPRSRHQGVASAAFAGAAGDRDERRQAGDGDEHLNRKYRPRRTLDQRDERG